MNQFNKTYWDERWKTGETQWDVGHPSTPLKKYIDGLTNKSMKILVPGAGNAYEGEYLLANGFANTVILDISEGPLEKIKKMSGVVEKNIVIGDFFEHKGQYDLILEQTFFCALQPDLRKKYVEQCANLLVKGGKIAGVLFNDDFKNNHPPFGGSAKEYTDLFSTLFEISIEPCYNSIEQRQNRELFVRFVKK
jgi:SAM-dependent methyltransferase